MNNLLKILWIGKHDTAKKEEGKLLVEVGAEIVPIGEDSVFDSSNEFWFSKCTIPIDILNIVRTNYMSEEAKNHINKYFDAVIVYAFPDVAAYFLSWYKGTVIFRVYGHGEYTTYTKLCEQLNVDKKLFNSPKYIWCPLTKAITDTETSNIKNNELPLHGFVTAQRLKKYKWYGKYSDSKIFEVFSQIERAYYNNLYENFKNNISNTDYIILGRNDKFYNNDFHILGTLEDDSFYNTMCSCRCLLYTGLSNKHFHYYANEALEMGIPVLFYKDSLIAYNSKLFGIDNSYLKKSGMYSSNEDAFQMVKNCISNVDFAVQISENQKVITNIAFSKQTAANQANIIFSKIKETK